ncbi:hypothetical protein BG011_001448, partial [Mortierella polycephala]
MEETQSFCLTGMTKIENIPIHHADGQNVIYWKDIKQAFPGVRHVKNGEVAVTMVKDSKGLRIMPCRIKHCPGVVLDVVLSTTVEHGQSNPSAALVRMGVTDAIDDALIADKAVDALQVVATPSVTSISEAKSSFQQVVKLALKKAQVFKIEQQLISSLDPVIQKKVRAFLLARDMSVQAHNVGCVEESERLRNESNGHFQEMKEIMAKNADAAAHTARLMEIKQDKLNAKLDELNAKLNAKQDEIKQLQIQGAKSMEAKQDELNAKQDEVRQMQIQARVNMKKMRDELMGQFSVLQSRVEAVLTQTYELHEYPIPRLFVVLPQDPSRWDTMDPFSNKFRLYFLCECGEHTKSIDSRTEIHFAKHEGYEITRPTEFFRLYGSHVFAILKMLQFGISVAGVVVPTISHLVRADVIEQAATYLQVLKDIEPMMNPIINWMDNVSANEGEAVDEFAKQLMNKEALAGADLRKLDTFLKTKDDDKVLGDLYRTVTDNGHVKWVCIDHYNEKYRDSTAKDFNRMLHSVGGSFDKSIGRVEVALPTRVLAEEFFSALGKARSVYELDIVFDWACSTSDLELLEGALKISTRVSILQLDLQQFQTSKLLPTSSQYGVLFRFPEILSLKTIHIVLPKEYIKRLRFLPKTAARPCKSSFELVTGRIGENEVRRLAEMLKTNSTLTILDLYGNSIGYDGAQALAKALMTNKTLTTLDLKDNRIGDNGVQALSEALETNKTLTTLYLKDNRIGDNGAQALAEALKTNTTLTTLDLQSNEIWFKGMFAFSEALKTNNTLTTLDLQNNRIGDNVAQALAEVLKTNKPLTILDLKDNRIGDDGAQALAEALKTNTTLTTLDLRGNGIRDDGAQ